MFDNYNILNKLHPGDNVLIEIPHLKTRLKVKYIGWVRERFMLTTTHLNSNIKQILINKPYVTVIFLADGKIYSGNTQVVHYQFRPIEIIFLAEPEKFDVMNLRKADRISSLLPAKIFDKGKKQKYDGVIVDISVGGCAFVIDDPENSKKLKTGEEVIVEFNLPNIDKALSIPSIIKRIFSKQDKVGFGIAFKTEEVDDIEAISSYIKDVAKILQ